MRAVNIRLIDEEARETMNAPLMSSTISSPLVRAHSVKSESGVIDANIRVPAGVWTPQTQASGTRTDSWVLGSGSTGKNDL